MATEPRQLLDSGPEVGEILVIDRLNWSVTEHSRYSNDEGYEVDEWECRHVDDLGYLLREGREEAQWLFTRSVPTDSVTLPGGDVLDRWFESAEGARPPDRLVFRGQTYAYGETTEGTYEDSSGERSGKTTWDYWDGSHTWNLAIERWADDGDVDCYHGRYISRDSIRVRAGATPAGTRPLRFFAVLAAMCFVAAAIMEFPIDVSLSVILGVMTVAAFIWLAVRARRAGVVALIAAPLLVWLFSRFPPLTSPAGLAAVVLIPAMSTRLAAMDDTSAHPTSAAFFTIAAPACAVGLYHYFWFAPGPHTFGQYVLALGPAALGGVVAWLVAKLVLKLSPER